MFQQQGTDDDPSPGAICHWQVELVPRLETDMKRGRFAEDQIIGVLREGAAGLKTADLCRRHAISEATFYAWKAKCGGLGVSEARRLRTLEDENGRLKRLLAEAMLDNAVLKDLAANSLLGVDRTSVRYRTRRPDDAPVRRGCASLWPGVVGSATGGWASCWRARVRG